MRVTWRDLPSKQVVAVMFFLDNAWLSRDAIASGFPRCAEDKRFCSVTVSSHQNKT